MRSEYPHYVHAMQINEPVSVVFDNRCRVAKAKCLAKLLYNNTLGYSEPAVHMVLVYNYCQTMH